MAYCSNCGSQIPEGANACPQCGHPRGSPPVPAPSAAAVVRRTDGSAIASLVLAIAGYFTCPIVFHVAAIIVGNQAQTKIRNDPTLEGEGLARAGVILGWIGIGVSLLAMITFGLLIALTGFSGVKVNY